MPGGGGGVASRGVPLSRSATHLRPSCPRQRLVVSPRKQSFAPDFWSCWRTGSRQFVQQRLCLFQIGGVETFGEPTVDRREEVAGFGVAALVAAEPGEARGGAQFPELSLLLLGDVQSFAIQFFGGLGLPLP